MGEGESVGGRKQFQAGTFHMKFAYYYYSTRSIPKHTMNQRTMIGVLWLWCCWSLTGGQLPTSPPAASSDCHLPPASFADLTDLFDILLTTLSAAHYLPNNRHLSHTGHRE